MSTAGVVIVYRDALFAEGLASLLRSNGAVEILAVLADNEAAANRVRALGPRVVILEGDPAESERPTCLGRLLEAAPCVIEVSLNGETAAVHRREHIGNCTRFVNLVTHLARRDPHV